MSSGITCWRPLKTTLLLFYFPKIFQKYKIFCENKSSSLDITIINKCHVTEYI